MLHKKIKLGALLFLAFGLTKIQAQSTMYVLENNGTQTPYAISGIRSLTFPTANVQVNKNDGSSVAYALSNIRYLNFNSLTTTISETDSKSVSYVTLSPNPVTDQFQISYNSVQASNVYLKIVDVQGRVLHQQTIISQSGNNQLQISTSQLPKGIYVCHLQNGNTIKNIKLIKH